MAAAHPTSKITPSTASATVGKFPDDVPGGIGNYFIDPLDGKSGCLSNPIDPRADLAMSVHAVEDEIMDGSDNSMDSKGRAGYRRRWRHGAASCPSCWHRAG